MAGQEPVTARATAVAGRVAGAVRTLNPGYFALVMATGIVSVSMQRHRQSGLSVALLWLAAICYVVLVVVFAWRVVAYRAETAADLADPGHGFGFFTFVAGTNVLGSRLTADGHHQVGYVLLAVGGLAWLVLGYLVPWAVSRGGRDPEPAAASANGTWFIWSVASQSVAALAAALEPALPSGRQAMALLAVFCWSVGIFLYAAAGMLVATRLMSGGLGPADLTPPYWVSMGATAITVVAGAQVVTMANTPAVAATRHLISGVSVLFWAFGTWLLPALAGAWLWRHAVHRVPLRYEPALWAIVFPLGMYSVAGYALDSDDHLPITRAIGEVEGWFALAAWALTFAAMLYHLYRTLWRPASEPAAPSPAAP